MGPKTAEGFAARYVVRKPGDLEILLALLLEAAAGGVTVPFTVPTELLDSDADPCYYTGRGRGSVPWPGHEQRGRGRRMWQQPLRGRAWPAYISQGRSIQPAGQPWLTVGQLVRPTGPRPQQWTPQKQPSATIQQQQHIGPMTTSIDAALPGVWQAPTSAAQLNSPDVARMQQLSIGRALGDQASHQAAAPAIPHPATLHMQPAEQRGTAGQMSHAASMGRQRPAPAPYRPPGW